MVKIITELLIACVIFIFGSYLIVHNSNWNLFWGIFLILWSNNIGLKYSNNNTTIKQMFEKS